MDDGNVVSERARTLRIVPDRDDDVSVAGIHQDPQAEINHQRQHDHEVVKGCASADESDRADLNRGNSGHPVVTAQEHAAEPPLVTRRLPEERFKDQGQHQKQQRDDPSADLSIKDEVSENHGHQGRRRNSRHNAEQRPAWNIDQVARNQSINVARDHKKRGLSKTEHAIIAPQERQPERHRNVKTEIRKVG